MKKILFLFTIALFLGCDTDDDGFYHVEYVRSDQPLIEIETQPNYAVNDVLYINAQIPFLLNQAGEPNPIDVRRTTGEAPAFELSYSLQRNVSGNTWEVVDVTGDFVGDVGQADAGYYVIATTTLLEDSYFFRGGLRLDATGTYRIVFNTNAKDDRLATIRSKSTGNNLVLNIHSSVIGTDGNYVFTVN